MRVPMQATLRLVKTVTGLQRASPTPAEAAAPLAASRDVYRLLHERVAAMRGVMDGAPVAAEVRLVGASCGMGGGERGRGVC